MSITIKIEADNLDKAKILSDEACENALMTCGQIYENHAGDYAPVNTGRLRNSIEHHMEGNDTVVIQTDVEYAVYQEMGTRRMKPHPFMRPAGLNHIGEYKKTIESMLK